MDRAALTRRVVDLARLAPSVHNTQPWTWRINTRPTTDSAELELWADRSRSLPVSDPIGRNLVISGGCALVYAAVAAEALGAEAKIDHLPEGPDSDLLARISLLPGTPSPEGQHRLALLSTRRTDRRRFTSWPVPEEKLDHLADTARRWGATVLPIIEPGLRAQVEELLEDARRRQLADPRIAEETERWIDHGQSDGVPEATLPHAEGVRGERPSRFGSGLVPESEDPVLRGTDRVLVVSTTDDGPLSWLYAGATLTAVWLQAAATGLSLVPLSQLVEVSRTRIGLEQLLPPPGRVPQVLARVGWQEIGREELPRTPRRSLDDVLGA
jgi:nitroreductase